MVDSARILRWVWASEDGIGVGAVGLRLFQERAIGYSEVALRLLQERLPNRPFTKALINLRLLCCTQQRWRRRWCIHNTPIVLNDLKDVIVFNDLKHVRVEVQKTKSGAAAEPIYFFIS